MCSFQSALDFVSIHLISISINHILGFIPLVFCSNLPCLLYILLLLVCNFDPPCVPFQPTFSFISIYLVLCFIPLSHLFKSALTSVLNLPCFPINLSYLSCHLTLASVSTYLDLRFNLPVFCFNLFLSSIAD